MTETNKSKDKIDTLVSLLKSKPEIVDLLIDSVIKEGAPKKKPKWRGRELVLFPNDEYKYLTPSELDAKNTVDDLVKKKTLSTEPSEATMNKFYQNGKIRALSKDDRFFAKQYYKQFHLQWRVNKK